MAYVHHPIKSPVVRSVLPNCQSDGGDASYRELICIKESSIEWKRLDFANQPPELVSLSEQVFVGHIRTHERVTVPECAQPRPEAGHNNDDEFGSENRAWRDLLCCTSDSGYLSFLELMEGTAERPPRARSVQQIEIAAPGVGYSDLGSSLAVDPRSRAIAVGALDGTVQIWRVQSIQEGIICPDQSVKVREEGVLWMMTFLSPERHSNTVRLAILKTLDEHLTIVIYEFDPGVMEEMKRWQEHRVSQEAVPLHLLALSSIPGGFVIVTDADMHYAVASKSRLEILVLPHLQISAAPSARQTVVAATASALCTAASTTAAQCIYLASQEGHLFRMTFGSSPNAVTSSHLIHTERKIRGLALISSGSSADHITWLLVVGDMCDGALIAIRQDGTVSVELNLDNWSPVLDFQLADIHGEGRDTMLLTSGAGDQGSLREIRVGIPAVTNASEDTGMDGAKAIWSLKRRLTDVDDTFLVLTFLEETRVMSLENSELQDLGPFVAFETSASTLYADNLTVGELHGQIHARGVVAANLGSDVGPSARWSCDRPVLGGCIAGDKIVIWSGNEVVALRVRVGSGPCSIPEISEEKRAHLDVNPSCLFAFSTFPGHGGRQAQFCAIGTFESSIELLSLDDGSLLETVGRTSLESDTRNVSIPQSFLSLVVPDEMRLLAGMRDGQLIDFTVTVEGGAGLPHVTLKRIAMHQVGVLPLILVPAQSGSGPSSTALAFSDSSWYMEYDSDREGLRLTMIACPRTVHATPFSYAHVKRGVMALIKGSLQFVVLGKRKEIIARTVKLGEGQVPRRVLYDRHTRRAVVAVTTKRGTHSAPIQSEIRVVDMLSGKVFAKEKLLPNEKICALTEWNVKEGKGYICVGTWGHVPPYGAGEPEGRVLVYNLKAYERKEPDTQSKTARKVVMYKMKQLGSISLAGPVQAICPFLNSYLLCAAGDSFVQLKIDAHTRTLVVRTSVAMRWPVHSISVAGNRVAVGGQQDSLSLWDYDPQNKQFTFSQSDRYIRTISDCIATGADSAIATDRAANLLGFGAVPAVMETTLRTDFAIHLGEPISRLRLGSMTHAASHPLDDDDGHSWCWADFRDDIIAGDKQRKVLYGASISGSLFAVVRLHSDAYSALNLLQRIMANHPATRPLLGNNHARFRSQGLNQQWSGCIDGDMIEQFLTLPTSIKEEIIALWARDSAAESFGGQSRASSLKDARKMALLIRTLQEACG
ncbi:hypothetical protein HDU87_000821 [Geranomyces variabilis]|uniref:Uncharacterized protein n=1 Tax=Geranomyces variabilis TaxID=109894 RepID=A0AAD5TNA3_9FUNG|nr:hypothetical protein HDU87_000821 [Geranomyces variabilis]